MFEDDLIARLRNALTQPGFSFRRRQDLRALVTLMRSRLKFQREDVTFSEQEALRLVFEKYVDLGALRDQLQGIQSNLPEYYASNQVSFSGGDVVDLAGDESRGVFEALSRRVYKTRNSVVHSKESGRPRYQPFRHDRELAQELPLMRILAEEVVVNSGGVVG